MATKRSGTRTSRKRASAKAKKKAPATKKAAKKTVVKPAAKKAATPARRKKPVATEERHWGGVGDAALRKATGRGWEEWLAVLDAAGARAMDHPAIATMLNQTHKVAGWWSQTITVGYEQARGMREPHQTRGGYEASRSKTIDAPVAEVFAAWNDTDERRRWLADPDVKIRKATPGRAIRLTWVDGETNVEVYLWPKTGTRTQIQLQHSKLKEAAAVERMKAYWGDQLERLRALLEA